MGTSKREDILEAALALFAERGFHGTAMPDLASAADVGAGTIYRHFESKEALVNELYRHWKARLAQEVFASLEPSLPWRARFRALWRNLFAFARAHPRVVDFLDLHHHGGYLDPQSQAIEAQSAAGFLGLVLAGQAEQALTDLPPAAVVAMTYSAFLGLIRAESEGYLVLDDALIDRAEQQVWAMIRST